MAHRIGCSRHNLHVRLPNFGTAENNKGWHCVEMNWFIIASWMWLLFVHVSLTSSGVTIVLMMYVRSEMGGIINAHGQRWSQMNGRNGSGYETDRVLRSAFKYYRPAPYPLVYCRRIENRKTESGVYKQIETQQQRPISDILTPVPRSHPASIHIPRNETRIYLYCYACGVPRHRPGLCGGLPNLSLSRVLRYRRQGCRSAKCCTTV